MTNKYGLLWFDNDNTIEFSKRLLRAAKYYKDKYNIDADTCYVHPSMIDKDQVISGISVKQDKTMLPNHFLLQMENIP